MSEQATVWTGRVLTGLFALFMAAASIAPKLLGIPIAEETMAQLGWPPGYAFAIGCLELTLLLLYLWPRTSVLGAVLMMGLLGGAMATQIRAGSPLFSHILFSLYLGVVMWGGLWLRHPRLRALFPLAGAGDGPAI
jgi:DoxX-like family